MARVEKERQDENQTPDEIEKTVDPYTGELVAVPEDADQFIEVVPEETDDRRGSNYLLNEETSMDSYAANADADAVAEQSAHYTEDKEIEEDFAERQKLASGGREALLEELEEHNSLSPRLTGGDIDAAWQDANVAGEEAVGGSVSTPDQDMVDELGEGAGLTYRADEPLDYDRKVLDRDRKRWEMDPASALDQDDDQEESGDEDFDEEDLEELLELDEEEDDELDDEEIEEDDLDVLDDEAEEDEDDIIDAELDDREDE
jgi:Family of unknown function (DUF6335)